MKAREILFLVVIGILVAVVGFLTYKTVSGKSERDLLRGEINQYRNAPADTIIKLDTIYIQGGTIIKPMPVRVEIHDTVMVPYRVSWYDTTYRDGIIKFRWRSKVIGEIEQITFSDFIYPKEIVTITTHLDTCFSKPPEYRAKFLHYGLYTEVVLNDFTKFPGFGLGVQTIWKDRLTISAGAVYHQSGIYGNLRIGVLFK